jgi:hypothetical protein
MALKTQGVLDLVNRALNRIPMPYGEDIVDDVALDIKKHELSQYNALCGPLTSSVVNCWIGRWTSIILKRTSAGQFSATKGSIISSYSKLP